MPRTQPDNTDDRPKFDATNQDEVAAFIDAHGFDAFRAERHRQTGYTVTETTTAPAEG